MATLEDLLQAYYLFGSHTYSGSSVLGFIEPTLLGGPVFGYVDMMTQKVWIYQFPGHVDIDLRY